MTRNVMSIKEEFCTNGWLVDLMILGTNFSPIRTPGEILSFGVSPVNYSGSDSCGNASWSDKIFVHFY